MTHPNPERRKNMAIEVVTSKNGDAGVPCCGNCPMGFKSQDPNNVECHHGRPPSGIPIPQGPGLVQGGRQQMQIAIHWPWPQVLKTEVCDAHPRFAEHPNWTSRMPAGQGVPSGG
jgi:hypothetical protein